MTVRPMRESDINALKDLYQLQGFSYTFPDLNGPQMAAVMVVADDDDTPICAAAARVIPELYLWCGKVPPAAMLRYVRMLHDAMAIRLRELGYHEANAYLPPEVDGRFGRWLERRFGWVRSWKAWGVSF